MDGMDGMGGPAFAAGCSQPPPRAMNSATWSAATWSRSRRPTTHWATRRWWRPICCSRCCARCRASQPAEGGPIITAPMPQPEPASGPPPIPLVSADFPSAHAEPAPYPGGNGSGATPPERAPAVDPARPTGGVGSGDSSRLGGRSAGARPERERGSERGGRRRTEAETSSEARRIGSSSHTCQSRGCPRRRADHRSELGAELGADPGAPAGTRSESQPDARSVLTSLVLCTEVGSASTMRPAPRCRRLRSPRAA